MYKDTSGSYHRNAGARFRQWRSPFLARVQISAHHLHPLVHPFRISFCGESPRPPLWNVNQRRPKQTNLPSNFGWKSLQSKHTGQQKHILCNQKAAKFLARPNVEKEILHPSETSHEKVLFLCEISVILQMRGDAINVCYDRTSVQRYWEDRNYNESSTFEIYLQIEADDIKLLIKMSSSKEEIIMINQWMWFRVPIK